MDRFEDFAKQIVHIKQDVIKHGELPAPIKQIIARFAGHEAWRVGVSIPDPLISTFEKCSNCAGTKQFFVRILENGKMRSPNNKSASFYEPHNCWYPSTVQIYPCPVCSPERLTEVQAGSSGLSISEWQKSMARDFLPMEGKRELRDIGLKVLADEDPFGWITLHGSYGVGKSHWLQCLVADFVRQGITAKYVPMVQILTDITSTFDKKGIGVEDIVASYAEIRILAIDEVDRVPKGSWHMAECFKFLDMRYRASVEDKKQLTIMALNEDLGRSSPEFDQLFGYLKSRMSGGMIIKVGGDDLRPVAGDDMAQKYTGGA